MDKLIDKIWWESCRSALKSDSEMCEIMRKPDFEEAVDNINSERKCSNCKHCCMDIINLNKDIYKWYCLADKDHASPYCQTHTTPFCFTNLFEMKEANDSPRRP